MKTLRMILWSAVVMAMLVIGIVFVASEGHRPAAAVETSTTSGFRADFELTDHTGLSKTAEAFRGRWMLVFFGFTNCPDVCPLGLSTIAQVMDGLSDESAAVQPLFITIDPERDTWAVLAEYVPQFGPGILGLSGSPEQIKQTAENFKIFFQKSDEDSAPDNYTMSHTSSFLLFDPQGNFVRTYKSDQEPAQIISDLMERIDR